MHCACLLSVCLPGRSGPGDERLACSVVCTGLTRVQLGTVPGTGDEFLFCSRPSWITRRLPRLAGSGLPPRALQAALALCSLELSPALLYLLFFPHALAASYRQAFAHADPSAWTIPASSTITMTDSQAS